MEKLEVFAIDKARCRLTGSIPYISLLWARRYYECGYCMIQIPAHIYTEEWAYICTPDRPETMRIQKVEYHDSDTTGEGSDTIILWGYFLESYMFDHTFLVEERRQWEELVQSTRPRNPMTNIIAENEKKTLYQNAEGVFICTDAQGNLREGEEFGLITPVMARDVFEDNGLNKVEYYYPINSYFYNDTDGHLHWVNDFGNDEDVSSRVVATDGTTSYIENGGSIYKASGVTTKTEIDTYKIALRNYVNKTTRTVTVKGYWQTLDANDPYQKIDPIQHLMQWVQNFYQNGLIFAEPEISGEPRVIDPSLRSLGQVLYDELKLEESSFRIVYDFELDKMVFEFWKGKDRTQSQTNNPWSVFSDEWGTLYGFTATTDTSQYKNTCYVLYDYDEPISWDGDAPHVEPEYSWDGGGVSRTLIGWKIPYKENKGFDKITIGDADEPERAIYLDLRSSKPDMDGEWSRDMYSANANDPNQGKPTFSKNIKASYTGFKAGLKTQALETLKNDHCIIQTLDTGTLNADNYLDKFDLGDKVDETVSQIGLVKENRIIGVDETYEMNGTDYTTTINVILGEEKITAARKVRLV